MNKEVSVAIAGLGSRGKDIYAKYAHNSEYGMKIVAIADIIDEKVQEVANEYNVPHEKCFSSAEDMLNQDKLADAMFICTQDRQHISHAIPAIKKGYHLLLEKPISPNLKECEEIAKVANEYKRKVIVCHVLRYTPFYQEIKKIISSGKIGDIVSIQAIENVGYWHQAHSFVRGNWSNSELTSPMILQKSCHDMDILLWLADKKCKQVSSFGDLRLFKADKSPAGATLRCMDGCKVKSECPYDAEKIYITNKDTGIAHGKNLWPCNILSSNPTEKTIREAIQTGPYGRCVYHCDNNVVDHQVVNLLLEDDTTISFTMCAFTSENSRSLKVMGTYGNIECDMGKNIIDIGIFGQEHEIIDVTTLADNLSGHGGGDARLIKNFIEIIREDNPTTGGLTSIDKSVESHYVALAAENSRLNKGAVVDIDKFVTNIVN